MTYKEVYESGVNQLKEHCKEAVLDARLLLEFICHTNRNDLLAHGDREVSEAEIKQYEALLLTEEVTISFSDEAIERIGDIAYQVNQETDNIGARRLHTILEKILEDLSYEASDISPAQIQITPAYIDSKLDNIVKNKDLSQFIL